MSLVDVDSWITEYEACDRLSREIQTQIAQRNREPKLSDDYGKLSASIRIRLKQFSTELDQLKSKLRNGNLTREEEERRQRQIESLQSKFVHIQTQFTNAINGASSRSELLKQSGSRLWDDDDDVPIHGTYNAAAGGNYSVDELRKQQTRVLEDQNEGLENLSKIISRQRELAIKIGDEVDVQNDIIDDLADDIERTDSRINSSTRNVQSVSTSESGTCSYWVVIIILLVAICVVALVF